MKVSYKTQIENEGWNIAVTDGATSGTVGKGLRLEAIVIELLDKGGLTVAIEAQAHVENIGWQPLKTDGEIIGTVGEGLRLEALRIRLIGADAKRYKIKYRLHVQNIGWQLWKVDGETAGTEGVALRAEAIEIMLELVEDNVVVVVPNTPADDPTQIIVPITDPNSAIPPEKILCASYSTHVENYGWGAEVTDGRLSGRVGQGLRMEAIRITLINTGSLNLGVAYSTYVENIGWQTEVADGATAGTTDQGIRLEAIKMHLTGTDAYKYSIWYRVHVQNEGWQEWCRDGDIAGTTTFALRAEAIQIIITLKSENLIRNPGDAPLIAVNYRSHIQNLAWASWVKNGAKSGTTGLGLRMEALEIKLSSLDGLDIGIKYRVHVQNIGWQDWFNDGATAGTVGQSLRIEAVEIILTGADASKYTVQYRGHLENTGWTSWYKNGATLGTTGENIRLEAVSIVLVKSADLNAVVTNEIKNNAPIISIWASNFPQADVLLHDIRTEYRLLSAKLTEGINKSSGFTFTIDPTHENYNKLRKMHTTIIVYEAYSNERIDLLFEGRIISDTEDYYKKRVVTCEGVLGYLLDSTQRPAQYINVTPEQWMTQVLDNHNMQVTSDKRLHMGICTVLGDGTGVKISTNYRTHIENLSWLSWVRNGDDSGTTGSGLRMEALELTLENIGNLDIGVTYRAHLDGTGWQEWVVDGETAGTVGQSVEMQAVEIKLTGADAGKFSIQYRVHVENEGWQDWKQDGETAGTTGQSLRAESIIIIIVSKVDGDASIAQDSVFRENEYVNTLELIKTTMLDTLGGVLVIERIGGIKFLNYLENYGSVNSQPIKFGVNLLDYSKITDAGGIYTVVVPYGKEIDGKKLTIATVNNGCDYIYDEVAVAEYGWITKEVEFPDIDSPSALMYAAELKLAGFINQGTSLELTAIDLSKINVDIQKFKVGDMVRCVSEPHSLDTFLSVSKRDRDLLEQGNDRVAMGGVTQSLTDRISGPLGGEIMGFALATANSVKNMEYVSNELSFLIRITADATTETEHRLDEAEFKITAEAITSTVRSSVEYLADLNSKASAEDLGSLTTRISTAEQKITSDAIISTVTQSSTYVNQITGKANKLTIISEINQTAEAIKISAEKIDFNGLSTFNGNVIMNGSQALRINDLSGNKVGEARFIDNSATTDGQKAMRVNGERELELSAGESWSYGSGVFIKANNKRAFAVQDYAFMTVSMGIPNKMNISMTDGPGSPLLSMTNSYGDVSIRGNTTYISNLEAANDPYNIPLTSPTYANKVAKLQYLPSPSRIEFYIGTSDSGVATHYVVDITASDERLKTNIKDTKVEAVKTLKKARIREFNWIEDMRFDDCGIIAQEAEKDIGQKYVAKVDQGNGEYTYQMKTYEFVPLLIKSVQELDEKIESQQSEIDALKKQVTELMEKIGGANG